LPRRQAIGDRRGVLHTLAGIAGYWHAIGQRVDAVTLASAVRSLSTSLHLPLDRPEQRLVDEVLTSARHQLDRAILAQALTRGEALTLEEAVALVTKR
jgi:hypothetical protein